VAISDDELDAILNGLKPAPGRAPMQRELALDAEPPSTVAYVGTLLRDYDAAAPRSQQTNLGPSELGTPCDRQIAMKLARVPQHRRPEPPWAPLQGTAIHSGLAEPMLHFDNQRRGRPYRWTVEERLRVDDQVSGRGDAYDAEHALVIDWKYVGKTTLRSASRRTIPTAQRVRADYRTQLHLYGLGHENAGRPVRWVRIVFLPRTAFYADAVEWTERYDPAVAEQALARYRRIREQVEAADMAFNPHLLDQVPAAVSDDNCKWCPFLRPGGPASSSGCPGNTADLAEKAEENSLI
jgi:hypothetical protein